MKEALFYKKLNNNKVQCTLCPFNCIIENNKKGNCKVRQNINGKLYSLVYDKIISTNVDPIEKKPSYHFYPGTKTLSISTIGCNFKCKYCQNYQISQGEIEGLNISPKEIVNLAKINNCKSISYTYTEPTIFYELTLEVAKIAKKEGIFNTYVTNGYINLEPIKEIAPYLDEVTLNFKGSGEKNFLQKYASVPSPEPIFKALKEYKKQKIFIEITNLFIPKIGDSLKDFEILLNWIKENLGLETPLHLLRFFPAYLLDYLEMTPIETLKKAYELSKKKGFLYVYIGNVKDETNNTYCPNCNMLLIERDNTIINKIKNFKCPQCQTDINIKM